MFMIDLSFHICLEQKKPDDCIVNIPILKNAKLAKPFCNWNMGYIKSGDKYYKSLEIKLVVVNLIYSLTTVYITLSIYLLYIPHQWCNG
jgi:hypothetical protein